MIPIGNMLFEEGFMVLNIKIKLKFNYRIFDRASFLDSESLLIRDLLIPKANNLKKTSTTSIFHNLASLTFTTEKIIKLFFLSIFYFLNFIYVVKLCNRVHIHVIWFLSFYFTIFAFN